METAESTVTKPPSVLPRWLPWTHGIILAITLSFWGVFLSRTEPLGYVFQRDFLCVYVGARAVAAGQGSQLYDAEVQWKYTNSAISPYHRYTLLPFVYPAYVAVLFSPLGKISLVKAFLLWTVFNLLLAAWLVRRLLSYPSVFAGQKVVLLVAVLAWVPLQLTLSQGQLGLVCAVALSEAVISLEARKEWLAGCWLALGLVKPQLIAVPLLALLLWRSWRAIATFLGILAAVLVASFAQIGFWIPAYLRFLAEFNRNGRAWSMYPWAMQNWRGLVYGLLGNSTAGYWLLAAMSLLSIFVVVFVCLGGGGTGSVVRRPLPNKWKIRFSISILIGLLVSPHLYFHDWVVALPALALLFISGIEWSRAKNRCDWQVATLLWLIALSPIVCFAVQFQVWPKTTPIQLAPWYMGFLTAMAVLSLWRSDKKNLLEKTSQ